MQKIPYINKKPLYSEAGSVFPYSAALVRTHTFEAKYKEEDETGLIPLYRLLPNGLMEIPRKCSPINPHDDRRVDGVNIKVNSLFKARNIEQTRVIDESTDLLKKGISHILSASTGFGKTVVGSEVAGRVGKKTLIVIPKSDIKDQWIASLVAILGVSKKRIGYIGGDICDVVEKDFVIGMVQSLCKAERYPSWVYKEFGLVIFDEVHRLGADHFSQAIWHFPAKLRLGLSATTDRKDGKSIVFKAHIGPVMVTTAMQTMIPKILIQPSGWSVPMTKRNVRKNGKVVLQDVPIPHSPGKTMHIFKMMARSVSRNRVICEFVVSAYKAGRHTVVMSDLRDAHLLPLMKMLLSMGIPKEDIGMYVGVSTKKEKEQREKDKTKPIVLTTYKMTAEATDVPMWDTLVFATPKSDVVQIVGRIRRELEGKKQPVVFDLLDGNSTVFRGYSYQRRKWYESIGCDMRRFK